MRSRLTMFFEYVRRTGDQEELVARGEQHVAFLRKEGDRMVPTPVPEALRAYADG